MTIGEWIDQRDRRVPAALRSRLRADGTATLEALLSAAEAELEVCAGLANQDRAAAFALLAADAYLTYACLRAAAGRGCGDALREITRRTAGGWSARAEA
ncbi:MAG: hypothetical protein OXE96_11745 [Gemmatimonadetes bacterium]|nr:hypothetical protein [Gemmatimonadota bacterium]